MTLCQAGGPNATATSSLSMQRSLGFACSSPDPRRRLGSCCSYRLGRHHLASVKRFFKPRSKVSWVVCACGGGSGHLRVSWRTEGCRSVQTKSLCTPLSAVVVRIDARRSGKGFEEMARLLRVRGRSSPQTF
jgi:hypothetical protein